MAKGKNKYALHSPPFYSQAQWEHHQRVRRKFQWKFLNNSKSVKENSPSRPSAHHTTTGAMFRKESKLFYLANSFRFPVASTSGEEHSTLSTLTESTNERTSFLCQHFIFTEKSKKSFAITRDEFHSRICFFFFFLRFKVSLLCNCSVWVRMLDITSLPNKMVQWTDKRRRFASINVSIFWRVLECVCTALDGGYLLFVLWTVCIRRMLLHFRHPWHCIMFQDLMKKVENAMRLSAQLFLPCLNSLRWVGKTYLCESRCTLTTRVKHLASFIPRFFSLSSLKCSSE